MNRGDLEGKLSRRQTEEMRRTEIKGDQRRKR